MPLLRWLRAAFDRYAPGAARFLPWIGGALMTLAALLAAQSWLLARPQQRAIATVVENVASLLPAGGVVYTPRLRFRTPDGRLMQLVVPPASAAPEFPPGKIVPVLYPTGHPEQAIIATVLRYYRTSITLAVIGIALFDIGLILRLVLRRRS